MTRQEIIDGFHKLYIAKIAEETAKRGKVGARSGGGIPIKELTRIHNEAIADYVLALMVRERNLLQCIAGAATE